MDDSGTAAEFMMAKAMVIITGVKKGIGGFEKWTQKGRYQNYGYDGWTEELCVIPSAVGFYSALGTLKDFWCLKWIVVKLYILYISVFEGDLRRQFFMILKGDLILVDICLFALNAIVRRTVAEQ